MKAIVMTLLIAGMIFTIRGALEQFNQFLDPSPIQTESLTISDKGIYYQPLPVDFLAGTSRLTGSRVRVPVLPEAAQKFAVGQQFDIVVGSGLFRKTWIFPADKHADYRALSFRIPYLGFFAGILVLFTFVTFRAARRRGVSKQKTAGVYFGFMAIGFAAFYLT